MRTHPTLRELRREARRIDRRALAVTVYPEVNDVTLVTDDDRLPTGWSACPTCGNPYRHTDPICAVCRMDLATYRAAMKEEQT